MKLLFLIFTLLPWYSFAQIRGEIGIQSRTFKEDNNPGTIDRDMTIIPRIQGLYEKGNFSAKLASYYQWDPSNSTRSIFYAEDAYLAYFIDNFEIYLGAKTVNWSSLEAFHPADVINSRNFDTNLEDLAKIGEPMLHVSYLTDNGSFNLFYMPYITDPNFIRTNNRNSFIDSDFTIADPKYLDENGRERESNWLAQYAFRFEQTWDDLDFSIYHLFQQDRQQGLFGIEPPDFDEIIPYTLAKFQSGVIAQYSYEQFIFKLETASLDFQNSDDFSITDHQQNAAGVDFVISHTNGSESSILLEIQKLEGLPKEEAQTINFFQNDTLYGYRFALNDEYSKEFLFTLIKDNQRENESIYSATYSQRLTDTWKVKVNARVVNAPVKDEGNSVGLENFHDNNSFTLKLTRYF